MHARTTFVSVALALSFVAPVAHAGGRTIDLGSGVSLELVEVPAGRFTQGTKQGTPGHADDETEREVTISKAFLIGKSPVTVAAWQRFAEDTSYRTEAEKGTSGGFGWNGKDLVQDKKYTWKSPGYESGPTHPVTIVTFGDAQAFAAWLGTRAGFEVRLPTEAEYEYAARGGSKGRFAWGDDPEAAEAHAWFAKNVGAGAKPVGQKPPNAYGLVDMTGNVWAWCADWYTPIAPAAATDPLADKSVVWPMSDKPRRVLKGGSWRTDDREKLRPATRYRATDGSRNADFGFRVVGVPGKAPPASAVPLEGPSKDTSRKDEPDRDTSKKAKETGSAIGSGLVMGLVALVVAGFVGVVGFILVKAGRKGGVDARARKLAPGSPYRARIAPDGFWIDAPAGAVPGQEVSYAARVQHRMVRGRARLSGSNQGTFVYTGAPPSDVSFVDLFVAQQVATPAARPFHEDTSHTHATSTGWPSAY